MTGIAVIGSRTPSDRSVKAVCSWLDNYLNEHSLEDITIVSGGAFGMDTEAMNYAVSRRLKLLVFAPGKFHNHKRCDELRDDPVCKIINTGLGYLERNTRIIEHADLVVSSDYGNGTIDTIKKAVRKKLPVFVLGNYVPSSALRKSLPESDCITLLGC